MSLVETHLFKHVMKQCLYKCKAYSRVFNSMILLQLFAIFSSFGGTGSGGFSSSSIEINVTYYSSNIVIFFTLLWALFTSVVVATRAYMEDFTFVTTRITSHLSNALFLFAASIIGGLTSMLSSFLLQLIIYGTGAHPILSGKAGIMDFILGVAAVSLYIFLFCSIGYLVGTFIHLHKAFVVIIPVIFVGLLILGGRGTFGSIGVAVFEFFTAESLFILFFIKIIVTAGLLFAGSIAIFNRLEVRQ